MTFIHKTAAGLSAAVAAAFLLQAPAFAASSQPPTKIGVVSLERLLRESDLAKASFDKLQKDFSRRKAAVDKQKADLKTRTDKFKKDAPAMGQTQRMNEQRELAEAERALAREQRALREELGQRQNDDMQILIARANSVIQEIAKRENYDLILQDGVYFSPRIDITDKVLKELK